MAPCSSLLDFIKTADPRKVRAVEVQKGDDQVTLLESTRHCFMPMVIPVAGGSSYVAATEIPAPTEGGQEDAAEENAYLELTDPDEGTAMVRQSEEELRTDHPVLASGAGGKTLALLLLIRPAKVLWILLPERTSKSVLLSSALATPVDTTVAATTSTGAAATTKLATDVNPDLVGPSHPEESEGSDDSFYSPTTLDPSEAKRYVTSMLLEEKDLEILKLKSKLEGGGSREGYPPP
ncbi:hypothetical protein Tco_1521442 [Tanacetum coccineum]